MIEKPFTEASAGAPSGPGSRVENGEHHECSRMIGERLSLFFFYTPTDTHTVKKKKSHSKPFTCKAHSHKPHVNGKGVWIKGPALSLD